MSNRSRVLLLAALLSAGAACNSGRYSPAGFRLPPDGDLERGRLTFAELGCPACHSVASTEAAKPAAQPSTTVILGGEVDRRLSDGYLVTSMIHPSHQFAPFPKDQIARGGVSRMPSYADRMTVRQMIDVVAFLQSRYTVRQTFPTYAYR